MKIIRYILAIFGLGRGYEMTLRNSALGNEFDKFRDGLFVSLVFVPTFIYGLWIEAFDVLWTFIIAAVTIYGLLTAVLGARSSYRAFELMYPSHDWKNSMGWLKSKQFMLKRRFRGVGDKGRRSWSPRFGLLNPELSAIMHIDPEWANKRNLSELELDLTRKADLWRHYRSNSSLFEWASDNLIRWYRWHVLFYAMPVALIVVASNWNVLNALVGLAMILGGWRYEIWLTNKLRKDIDRQKSSVSAKVSDPLEQARDDLDEDARLSFNHVRP